MMHPVFLTFLFCCGLGALTSALPARPASNTDAEASDEPDLIHMLDYFKGKSDMTMLVTFLEQAKVLRTSMKGVVDICTICQQVFLEAGKSNVGFRILDKVVEGHAPDIRDMYDLATQGFGNMGTAYNEARKKNKKFNNLVNIFLTNSSELLSSPSSLYDELLTMTGKKFTINPEVFEEFKSGTIQINVNNMAEVNLLEMASYWIRNSNGFYQFFEKLMTPPLDTQALLDIYKHFDTSDLAMIKSINGGMNNSKYAVAGAKQTLVTDPLAAEILKGLAQVPDFQKGKSNDKSADSMLLNLLNDFMKLTSQVLKAAEENRKVSTP